MLPPLDAAFLACRALGLDGATLTFGRLVVPEQLAVLLAVEPPCQGLARRTAICILLGQVDEILLAEPSFGLRARGQRLGDVIPIGLCADLIDGLDDPGKAGERGEAPGLVT